MDWNLVIWIGIGNGLLLACLISIVQNYKDIVKSNKIRKEKEQARIIKMMKEGPNYGKTNWAGPR